MPTPAELSQTMARLLSQQSTVDEQSNAEMTLLNVLNEEGMEALAAFLSGLPEYPFHAQPEETESPMVTFVTADSPPRIRVIVYAEEDLLSVQLDVQLANSTTQLGATAKSPSQPPPADPRHAAFYGIWESMLDLDDAEVPDLSTVRRAVYLVALLEAEVMNGGLGQYLANSEGQHIEATLHLLRDIGAVKTTALLEQAAALRGDAKSWDAVWDDHGPALDALDDQFYASGEDLAGATADRFGLVP